MIRSATTYLNLVDSEATRQLAISPDSVLRQAVTRWLTNTHESTPPSSSSQDFLLPNHLVGTCMEIWVFLATHQSIIFPANSNVIVPPFDEFQQAILQREPHEFLIKALIALTGLALQKNNLLGLMDLLNPMTMPELARCCVTFALGYEISADMTQTRPSSWNVLERNPDCAFVKEGEQLLGQGTGNDALCHPAWIMHFVDMQRHVQKQRGDDDVSPWIQKIESNLGPVGLSKISYRIVLQDKLWEHAVLCNSIVGRDFVLRCDAIINRLRLQLSDWQWGAGIRASLRAGYYGGSANTFYNDVMKSLPENAPGNVRDLVRDLVLTWLIETAPQSNPNSNDPWTRWSRVNSRVEYDSICSACRAPLNALTGGGKKGGGGNGSHHHPHHRSAAAAAAAAAATSITSECEKCLLRFHMSASSSSPTCLASPAIKDIRKCMACAAASHNDLQQKKNMVVSHTPFLSVSGILTMNDDGFATMPTTSPPTQLANTPPTIAHHHVLRLDTLVECLRFREAYDWTLDERISLLIFLTHEAQGTDVVRVYAEEAMTKVEEVRKELSKIKKARIDEWIVALKQCCVLGFRDGDEEKKLKRRRMLQGHDAMTSHSVMSVADGGGDDDDLAFIDKMDNDGDDHDSVDFDIKTTSDAGEEDELVIQLAREEENNGISPQGTLAERLGSSKKRKRQRPSPSSSSPPSPLPPHDAKEEASELPHTTTMNNGDAPQTPSANNRRPRNNDDGHPLTCTGCGLPFNDDGQSATTFPREDVKWAFVHMADSNDFCAPTHTSPNEDVWFHPTCARLAERIATSRKKYVEPVLEPMAIRLFAIESEVIAKTYSPRIEPLGFVDHRAFYIFPSDRHVVYSESTRFEGAWRKHSPQSRDFVSMLERGSVSLAGNVGGGSTLQQTPPNNNVDDLNNLLLVARLMNGDLYNNNNSNGGITALPAFNFPPKSIPTMQAPDDYTIHDPLTTFPNITSHQLISWIFSPNKTTCGFCGDGVDEGEAHCTWCHTTFLVPNSEALAPHATTCKLACSRERAGFALASRGFCPQSAPGQESWNQLIILKRMLLTLEAALPLGATSRTKWTTETRGAWCLKVKTCTTPAQLLSCVAVLEAVLDVSRWCDRTYRLPAVGKLMCITIGFVATRIMALDRAIKWSMALQ